MNEQTATAQEPHAAVKPESGFARVVCGIDGSEASFVALDQARPLAAPDGRLLALTICNEAISVRAGMEAPRLAALLREEAEEARARAAAQLQERPLSSAVVVRGRPTDALLRALEREQADLIAVGSRGGGRVAGMLLGSVATAMLHEATCSVLVARSGAHPGAFPQRIVVGDDGSPAAGEALAAAEWIAARTGAAVRSVVALGGKKPELDRVAGAERDPRHAVAALRAAAAATDLLVVGSRGLHGIAALGSVSERVAHQASCSVLVVRSRS